MNVLLYNRERAKACMHLYHILGTHQSKINDYTMVLEDVVGNTMFSSDLHARKRANLVHIHNSNKTLYIPPTSLWRDASSSVRRIGTLAFIFCFFPS